jgi:hypothetical protein
MIIVTFERRVSSTQSSEDSRMTQTAVLTPRFAISEKEIRFLYYFFNAKFEIIFGRFLSFIVNNLNIVTTTVHVVERII